MILSILVLGFVTLQRLGELVLARRNTERLLDRGGLEVGGAHYPYIVVLHAAWLGGLWYLGWNEPANLAWLAVYVVLQGLRIWTLASLGDRWTTRIIVVPGEPLVRRGPYRWLPHPNYVVVAGEIVVLPLVFDLFQYAVVFSVLNAIILWVRIRAESAALSDATRTRSEPPTARSPARPG